MTIRKIVVVSIAAAITLVAFGIPNGFCADVAKIGTVDFQRIFENSAAGKAAKSQINQEGQLMNADLDKIQTDIKELQNFIDKNNSSGVVSKAALDDKKWELNRKVEEVKALKKRFDHKIQTMQVQLINTVRKDVLSVIADYGKKEGFLLIIEEMGVVYAPQSLDITDKIIQLYNAAYAKQDKKK
jgi:outer membrane protein